MEATVGQPAAHEQQQPEQGEGSEPYTARRAESLDATGVQLLLKRQTEAVFGRLNVDNVIERANLAITLAGKNDEVLAFGALFDYPTSASGVDSTCWEEWLHGNYECKLANPMNSLFLGLFVAKDGFKEGALAEILRMTFVAVPLVHYVFLPVAATVPVGPVIESHFSPVPVYDDSTASYILWAAHRHQHFSVLHVRSAKVEDNDDLMPIFQQLPGDMTSQYGEYFIAELVEAEDDTHKTLVVEVGGRAVGLISLSSELDLPLLQQCYQLEPYHGLCKPCDQDEIIMVPDDSNESVCNYDKPALASQQSTQSHSSIQSDPVLPADSVESEKQAPSSPQQEGGGVLAADSIASEQTTTLSSDSTHQEHPAGVVAPDKETTDEPKAEAAPDNELPSPGTPPPAPSSPEAPSPAPVAPVVAERPKVVYHGSSNAVAVRLFCIDDQYEMRSIDFLPAVFQLFPECDFLVLTQPHASPEFPLLSHFTRVPPQLRSTLPQELYVLHKCSLLHSLKVVPMCDSHYDGVLTLSATLNSSANLLTDVKHYLQAGRDPLDQGATRMRVFIAECLEQVVGVIVLRQEEDIRYLRSHYNMEDFVFYSQHRPHEHQHIHHLLLNPAFTPHTKHFLKEAMRQSESTCLYYPLHPPTTTSGDDGITVTNKPHSHIAALTEMVPIHARRQVVYPAGLGLNSPAPELLETKPPFSLYHTSRKLSLEPKACVNARIVVVGASDTALSLLETLVFSPHLRFNNLMLVSPHGLPSTSTLSSSHMPFSCRFGPEALLGLSAWVGVAKGWLTTINREEQWVGVVSDSGKETVVPYDYLVLCTGAQFVKEPSASAAREIPRQVFSLGSREQALQLMDWVAQQLVPVDNGRLVVYGSTLTAYSCLRYLLDVVGLSGDRITLVLPPSDPSCFNNATVEKQMQQALSTTGVEVLDGYHVVCYNPAMEPSLSDLHSVQLASSTDTITVNCRAMICAASKHVNDIAFQAINDACLVFDYRLVINTAHSTNDPRVLAAGPLTKYSRVYYADQWTHDRFCSREVGQKLASTLLNILDPTQPLGTTSTTSSDEISNDLLPVYTRPTIISAALPGGLHYMHIEKPNLGEKLDVLMKKLDYGREIVTQSSNGYFRLHLNQYNRVQTITVLSLEPFEESNYACLYNIHEKYLNSLVSRYDEGLIRDFFQYFREEWASAVFHDRFPDFLREIQDILSTPTDGEQMSVLAKVQQMVEDGHSLSVDSYQPQLATEFAQSPLRTVLIRRLHRYLHYNSYHLPMFSHPDMT